MFPVLFTEYGGKNIREFIHSGCIVGLLRKKKTYWTIFRTTPGIIVFWSKSGCRYYVLIQNAKFKPILEVEENCFQKNGYREEILRWILCKNRVVTPFRIFADIVAFWNKIPKLYLGCIYKEAKFEKNNFLRI